MDTLKLRLMGTSPLLMHSDKFANPLDADSKAHKALTGKRKKTPEDQMDIARSEWLGSLYFDSKFGPYLPTQNVRAALIGGGKMHKLGTALMKGSLILDDKAPLDYKGPRDPEKLWENGKFVDCRSVVVSKSRLMRYRPIFREWALSVEVFFDTGMLEAEQIRASMENAGRFIGIGDFRPERGGSFGRFEVEAAK